jgi:hypothetical protein
MCQWVNIAVHQSYRRTTEDSPITVVTLGGDQVAKSQEFASADLVSCARKRKAKPWNGSALSRSVVGRSSRSAASVDPLSSIRCHRQTTEKLRGYCTVRLIVVMCVRAPDCAVTTMDAGPGFVFVLPELPHPVEASSVPAISRLANPPNNSENKRRRFAPAPAKKQPKTPNPVSAIPISLGAA